MAFPLGKHDDLWIANSGAMRDAIAAEDGLLVGDRCNLFGIIWHWTGVTWVEEGGGAAGGIYLNVKTYGMIAGGDGDDNTLALQAAIDAGAAFGSWATVIFPAASVPWNCNGEVELKPGVRLLGEGAGQSVLSFAGGTGTFTHDGALWCEGDQGTLMPVQEFVINEGSRSLGFVSTPAIAPRDLLMIYDEDDNSWDLHSVHQRKGEFFEAEGLAGDVVSTVGAFMDSYALADLADIYNLDPVTVTIEGLDLVGRGQDSEAAIWIDWGRDCKFHDCKITNNAGGICVWLSRCYHTQVLGGECSHVGSSIPEPDAIRIQHCQDVLIRDCNTAIDSSNSACVRVEASGVEKPGAAPSRLVRVEGGNHQSNDRTVVFSRNTDLCEVVGGQHEGELHLGGGRHNVHGTRFKHFKSEAIHAGSEDWHYLSFTVEGCTFEGNAVGADSRAVFCRQLNDDDLDRDENAIIIRNNKIVLTSPTGPAIDVLLDGEVGPGQIVIDDNEIRMHGVLTDYAVEVSTGASYGVAEPSGQLEDVSISGNKLYQGGVLTALDCALLTCSNNKITDAREHAFKIGAPLTARSVRQASHILGNSIRECVKNPVHYTGLSNEIGRLRVIGNAVERWGSGTAEEKVPVWTKSADSVTVQGNAFGGGPGSDFAPIHCDNVADLYWGGNSFPDIGTDDLLEPATFTVTNFWGGETWTNTEALKDFTEANRDIAWGTDLVSLTEALKLPKIQHSHDVWLMEVRVIADTAWENLNIGVYFDNNGSPEDTSGVMSEASGAWFIWRPKLFVPKGTDVRVNFTRDTDTGDGFATVTWLNVGHAGGAPPAP